MKILGGLLLALFCALVAARHSDFERCGRNAFFSDSYCNACDRDCRDLEEGSACARVCQPPACRCKEGFYRNHDDLCVSAHQCSSDQDGDEALSVRRSVAEFDPECGQNEYFANSDCNGCDMTCFERDHTVCAFVCHPAQCMCKPGFYRDPMGDRCVAPIECPAVQPPMGHHRKTPRSFDEFSFF